MKRALSLLVHTGLPLALVGVLIWVADAQSWSGEATGWGVATILGGATVVDLVVSRRLSKHRHKA